VCQAAKIALAGHHPVFEAPNCWKYEQGEQALAWFKEQKKFFLVEREPAGGDAVEIPDDF
ncbi:MAG: hypothetical protein ACO3YX_07870, partial [Candidatus Nanopelagicaceae bacterium]